MRAVAIHKQPEMLAESLQCCIKHVDEQTRAGWEREREGEGEGEGEILPCTDVDEREGHQISASQVGSATKTIH